MECFAVCFFFIPIFWLLGFSSGIMVHVIDLVGLIINVAYLTRDPIGSAFLGTVWPLVM